MSLLFHRRAIVRAVAGDLPPAAEARLRAHLRGCEPCRAHYDRLSHVAEAATGGRSTQAAARERVRLERALLATGAAAQMAPGPRSRRPWIMAGAVLAPAAALLLWFGRPPAPREVPDSPPAADVGLRGAESATPDAVSGPVLVVYASRRTAEGGRAPVRLVGELPGSGTVRVSRADYLQFGARGLTSAADVSITARSGSGPPHVFLPRAGGAAPRAEAGTHPAVVGPSFDLAREPAAGRYALTARFSRPSQHDGGAMDAPGVEVSGFLLIEP